MNHDPRVMDGVKMPTWRPEYPGETWWKPHGWNDNGAACTYQNCGSREAAEALVRELRTNGDPHNEGRRYQHYVVLELEAAVWVVQTTHEVAE